MRAYAERNGQWELHPHENPDKAAAKINGPMLGRSKLAVSGDVKVVTLLDLISTLKVWGNGYYDGLKNNCQIGADNIKKLAASAKSVEFQKAAQNMEEVARTIDLVRKSCKGIPPAVVEAVATCATLTLYGAALLTFPFATITTTVAIGAYSWWISPTVDLEQDIERLLESDEERFLDEDDDDLD